MAQCNIKVDLWPHMLEGFEEKMVLFILIFLCSLLQANCYNINNGIRLSRGPQIDEISLLAPAWYVSLDIRPYGNTPYWSNVIHFTADGKNINTHGSRVPAIFFKGRSRKLHICNPVNSDSNYCFDSEPLILNQYTKVEIKQHQLSDGKFRLEIKIGGESVHSVINDKARFFGNVKVYRSDPWYPTANALIKNLVYGNLPYEFKLAGRKQINTIPRYHEVYQVSFDIKPEAQATIPNDWRSIIRFSIKGNNKVYGSRVPAIFFHRGDHRLHICSAVSNNQNYCVDTPQSLPTNRFTTIKIIQNYNENGALIYRVFVDGVQLVEVVNTHPRRFKDVKVHLTDPYYKSANATIKNLIIKSDLGDTIITPEKDYEMTRIPFIGLQWYLSFDIKPTGTASSLSNIVHITKGGDESRIGDRVPSVSFLPGNTSIQICNSVGYIKSQCFESARNLTLNDYVNVRIRQTLDVKNNSYKIYVELNNSVIYNVWNNAAREFTNMFLYVSDPWKPAAKAEIKNLVFQNLPFGYTYDKCNEELSSDIDCNQYQSLSGFRSVEGVCNNLQHPTWGAAHTKLRRVVDPEYASDGKFDTPRGFPNTNPVLPPPNAVTQQLFDVENQNSGSTKKITTLFMTFGQFLDHDFTETPHQSCKQKCDVSNSWQYPCFPLLFDTTTNNCSANGRSTAVCSNRAYLSPRQQMNALSAFVDGSQIYDNQKAHFELLRDNTDGLMKITTDGLLPVEFAQGENGCFTVGGCSLAGDFRVDENIALHTMHTLWIRNHNNIARQLKSLNPRWSHDELFNNARKINSALWQHITYNEYLPVLANIPAYQGYKTDVDPSITNVFASAAFRYGHSLVPNQFEQLNVGFNRENDPVSLQSAFFNRQLINDRGIEQTMRGLVGNMSNNVDDKFSQAIARKLFLPIGAVGYLDLTALNIQRGRDHGLPGYNTYRKYCGLPVAENWTDIDSIMVPGAAAKFEKVYNHPDDIDIFAGGISEKHVTNLEIGATFNCLIGQQFKATRDGDRFYYENPGVFTAQQLIAIKKVTLSTILCLNLNSPGKPAGLVSIQPDAFHTPDANQNTRKTCSGNAIPKLNLTAWSEEQVVVPIQPIPVKDQESNQDNHIGNVFTENHGNDVGGSINSQKSEALSSINDALINLQDVLTKMKQQFHSDDLLNNLDEDTVEETHHQSKKNIHQRLKDYIHSKKNVESDIEGESVHVKDNNQ